MALLVGKIFCFLIFWFLLFGVHCQPDEDDSTVVDVGSKRKLGITDINVIESEPKRRRNVAYNTMSRVLPIIEPELPDFHTIDESYWYKHGVIGSNIKQGCMFKNKKYKTILINTTKY